MAYTVKVVIMVKEIIQEQEKNWHNDLDSLLRNQGGTELTYWQTD